MSAAKRKRRKADPIRPWARRLRERRPRLVAFVLDSVASLYGRPTWQRVHDPMSELVLTILSQNSADVNAEKAFDALAEAYPSAAPGIGVDAGTGDEAADADVAPDAGTDADADADVAPDADVARDAGTGVVAADADPDKVNRPGWGGNGVERRPAPDWMAVEQAPLDELVHVIRPGGLAQQKAPRIQASLARVREARGDHSLEFLAEMEPVEARDWLTSIDGVGKKTASVVLLFAFGMALMPVDRHVERVSKRIGLLPPKVTADEAHDRYLALLEPDERYLMHVGLITHGRQTCHARSPECDRCPIAPRCRYVDRSAP